MLVLFSMFIFGADPMQVEDPTVIIKKAIRARGKPDVQGEFVWRVTGTCSWGGKVRRFAQTSRVPDLLLHQEESWFERGRLIHTVLVGNGKEAWLSEGGETRECSAAEFAVLAEGMYRAEVAQLECLLDSKRFKLTAIPSLSVSGQECLGIKIECDKQQDIFLYFSKDTALLRQIATKRKGPDGKLYGHKELRSQYKNFNGCLVATKTMLEVEASPKFTKEEEIDKVEFVPLAESKKLFEKP